MNNYIQEKKEEFNNVIDFFKKEIINVKVGRANPSILDGIFVEAYGVKNPMSAVANISVSDARSMTLSPFDKIFPRVLKKLLLILIWEWA